MEQERKQVDTQIYTKETKPNTITQTFTQKRWETKQIRIREIGGANQREEIQEMPPTPSPLLIKDQNKNKSRSFDRKKH